MVCFRSSQSTHHLTEIRNRYIPVKLTDKHWLPGLYYNKTSTPHYFPIHFLSTKHIKTLQTIISKSCKKMFKTFWSPCAICQSNVHFTEMYASVFCKSLSANNSWVCLWLVALLTARNKLHHYQLAHVNHHDSVRVQAWHVQKALSDSLALSCGLIFLW